VQQAQREVGTEYRSDVRIAQADRVVRAWRLHDLLRTAATRIGELGHLVQAVAAIVSHISGHTAGVASTYNQAFYSAEKCKALKLCD
jgi:hypothetical protein